MTPQYKSDTCFALLSLYQRQTAFMTLGYQRDDDVTQSTRRRQHTVDVTMTSRYRRDVDNTL